MSIRKFSTASISAGTNKSTKLWDQETFQSGMFAIATVSLTSTASSIVFSSIPSNYTHLQLRMLTACSSASSGCAIQFNGDTGSNYKGHGLYGSGGGAGATVTNVIYAPNFMGGAITASPGAAIIDILDYASTTKAKVVRSIDGYDANGSGYVGLSSGLWTTSNAAITSITLSFTNFSSGTHVALYGIKAA